MFDLDGNSIPPIEEETPEQDNNEAIVVKELSELREEVYGLKDLFQRRLLEDKQKVELISTLREVAAFTVIEPFISDCILILDRLDKAKDDFAQSIREELYGLLNRRGVEKIVVTEEFNPSLNKAVRVEESAETDKVCVVGILRNGYTFCDKVIRPAEVAVVKPLSPAQ